MYLLCNGEPEKIFENRDDVGLGDGAEERATELWMLCSLLMTLDGSP